MALLVVVLLVLLFAALSPLAVSYLWNGLMPYLFQTPTISYWQALGLMVLSSLLFYRPSGGSSKK